MRGFGKVWGTENNENKFKSRVYLHEYNEVTIIPSDIFSLNWEIKAGEVGELESEYSGWKKIEN